MSVPGTPTLDSKDDSGTLNTATPTLQWSPVMNALGYDLYLTDTTTGTQVFDPLPVTTTSFRGNLPAQQRRHLPVGCLRLR